MSIDDEQQLRRFLGGGVGGGGGPAEFLGGSPVGGLQWRAGLPVQNAPPVDARPWVPVHPALITRMSTMDEASLLPKFPWPGLDPLLCVPPFASVLDEDHSECMICLDTFEQGHMVTRLPCQHLFHNLCISKWVLGKLRAGHPGTCPHCNFKVAFPVYGGTEDATGNVHISGHVAEEADCCGLSPDFHRRLSRALIIFVMSSILGAIIVFTSMWALQNAQKRKNGNYTAKSAVNSQGAVRQRAAAATHTAIRSATAATMTMTAATMNAAVALAASRK